ncbi:hypothetical protein DERF_002109 [Dermatophagoides farinae]|uniref:Uncharacterized protein n=1 Tax=Dermatophagoides farinae TaxID=6954 RepID=A0A922IAX5_DERFA|nr:hypothetical protein DERF_002109 [Dermatophagoides farinae]
MNLQSCLLQELNNDLDINLAFGTRTFDTTIRLFNDK